jgi:hypothetical protein
MPTWKSEPEGASTPTEIEELKMLHIRNSAPTVGSFCCSDTLFNQIFDLILWGIKSNMASVATDCPHREKLGWLEQTYLIGPSMHYNFNIHSLYRKIVYDMMDSQLENGLVPDIAPEYVPFQSGFRDSPEWGSASVIIPWQLYRWYGDTQILREAYPMMKRYVEYLRDKSENFILDYGLGDWYDLGPKHPGEAQLTPKAVTATTIFYYDLQLVCQTAKLLGYETDAQAFSELAGKVQKAFLENFTIRKPENVPPAARLLMACRFIRESFLPATVKRYSATLSIPSENTTTRLLRAISGIIFWFGC